MSRAGTKFALVFELKKKITEQIKSLVVLKFVNFSFHGLGVLTENQVN